MPSLHTFLQVERIASQFLPYIKLIDKLMYYESQSQGSHKNIVFMKRSWDLLSFALPN